VRGRRGRPSSRGSLRRRRRSPGPKLLLQALALEGLRPGHRSYRWLGTVLRASSLDRSTPTFCKFKDKKQRFLERVSRSAVVLPNVLLLHKAKDEQVLTPVSSTQGKVPACEQQSEARLRAHPSCYALRQGNHISTGAWHRAWWDRPPLHAVRSSQCF